MVLVVVIVGMIVFSLQEFDFLNDSRVFSIIDANTRLLFDVLQYVDGSLELFSGLLLGFVRSF
jgi:uncharacterized protein YqhQ